MFKFLKKDPVEKLNQRYLALLKEARDLQRSGDIPAFAKKTSEAEAVREEMEALKSAEGTS